jgi:hypothetical protein
LVAGAIVQSELRWQCGLPTSYRTTSEFDSLSPTGGLVAVSYSSTMRVAEPHDYGMQNGRERLLVFQLRGPSRSGQSPKGWRLLRTGKIESLAVLDGAFAGSREESDGGHLQ